MPTTRRRCLIASLAGLIVCLELAAAARADGPSDNDPRSVRPVPPRGMELSSDVLAELEERVGNLERQLTELVNPQPLEYGMCAVIPRAVRMTLESQMIYAPKDLERLRQLLTEGERRTSMIASPQHTVFELLGLPDSKLLAPQAVAGGFRSNIDGSYQPYGVVLPQGWSADHSPPLRLDVWLHGRGETVSEAAFMDQRMRDLGQYTPSNTIVLHPYGRYCNAFKFAGEIDVMEVVAHVQEIFAIDPQRITIRGFSMGGAGCWQLAVHYPDVWAAANPGAGFSETTQFLKIFQDEIFQPTPYQQKLLHWYDCPDWTNNLRHVPTIAYSGEIDRQKQAADVMQAAFEERGLQLPHVIGPQTAHKIHEDSKIEIEEWLSTKLQAGKPRLPKQIDFTTYSLRYHRLAWLSVEGLNQHWQEARVQAELQDNVIAITTQNVNRMRLEFADQSFASHAAVSIHIDGDHLQVAAGNHGGLQVVLSKRKSWQTDDDTNSATQPRVKRPGLQGPIDDAFMGRFAFVPPTPVTDGAAVQRSPVDLWIATEYAHATREWRRHFRGDVVELQASELSSDNLQQNLILFGTPQSNPFIAKIVDQLPFDWTATSLTFAGKTYSSAEHAPILIYPNPLSPEHYIVLNSGFTYREYAYLNNARQIPMLPDWAITNITDGSTSQTPGTILAAGFFDESWGL